MSLMGGNGAVRGASGIINGFIDPRDVWEHTILGNKRPGRNRASFSQEGGESVFRFVIGVIGVAMGCCIDRGAEVPS